jgi:16S rRNA A1518/A1519 N6-dimethyltransferase RsmA/KsgA/DIM1 with predicted DNA glycosylase/AP lyase activity
MTIEIDGVAIKLLNSTIGTYSITNIPYNVSADVLEQGFRQIVGFENVEI